MKIGDKVRHNGKLHYVVTNRKGELRLKPVDEFIRKTY